MFTVTKSISFCYGHRLLRYSGKCRFLHGHNGRAEITLTAKKLDHRGMVVDFTDVKGVVGKYIDEHLDHKMILSAQDPMLPLLQKSGEPHYVIAGNPTAENIAKLIYQFAKSQKLPVSSVKLWETDSSFAVYSS